jgi:hypothetical protein
MKKKCVVLGCENYPEYGEFIGDICAPCHAMISTGDFRHGTTIFHDMFNKYALAEYYPSTTQVNLENFFKILEHCWTKDARHNELQPSWKTEDIFDESYGIYRRRFYIFTRGHLTNGALIESMRKNKMLWKKTWEMSNSDGLHVFSFLIQDN